MAQIRLKHYGTPQKALQVIFKSSQTYTIDSKWKSADVFLVGGGCGGAGGSQSNVGWKYSPNGGNSGTTLTNKLISISTNSIVITIGGGGTGGLGANGGLAGGDTSVEINGTTITARGGGQLTYGGSGAGNMGYTNTKKTAYINGGNGGSDGSDGIYGSSGGSPGTWAVGRGQGTTTRAFEETTETLYAGGGGGGGYQNFNNSTGDNSWVQGGSGGAGGGGAGGTKTGITPVWNGIAGSANTGGGGGGGFWSQNNQSSYTPTNYRGGNGGSGVAIIRLYKNNNRPTDIDWSKCTIVLD